MQLRQFVESREEQPQPLRQMFDDVYEAPRAAVALCKRLLLNLGTKEREERIVRILSEMGDIGGSARGLALRAGGARPPPPGAPPTCAELDAKCKWLAGTLHLVVRTMWDAEETAQKMREVLDAALSRCRRLPWLASADLADPSRLPGVEQKLLELAAAAGGPQPRAAVACIAGGFRRLPEPEQLRVRRALMRCESLRSAMEQVDRAHEEFKMRLLHAENSQDDMGIEEFRRSLDRECGAADPRFDDVARKLREIGDAAQQGCGCIYGLLELAVERDRGIDPSETLARLQQIEDIVVRKVPSMAGFMRESLLASPEEVEGFVYRQLEGSSGVQDILERLAETTRYAAQLAPRLVRARSPPPPAARLTAVTYASAQ